jgi:BlaI family transcriptional regulator, penicillinase repressor
MAYMPQVSDAEWEVMKTLWEGPALTSGQVVERLGRERRWKPRTIKTLLARLVKKGAAGVRRDEKRVLYTASVPREALVRRESRSFIARVFDGAVTPALVHFLKDAQLSDDEIDELKKLLKQQERP